MLQPVHLTTRCHPLCHVYAKPFPLKLKAVESPKCNYDRSSIRHRNQVQEVSRQAGILTERQRQNLQGYNCALGPEDEVQAASVQEKVFANTKMGTWVWA